MGIKASLFWFGVILFLIVTWQIFDLPSNEELIVITKGWLGSYGLWMLFIGAFLESVLLVGFYFPGSVLIFIGVGLAPSIADAVIAVLVVDIAMLTGQSFNYFLGRYGWYKLLVRFGMKSGIENAQNKMLQNDVRYIAYTFWNAGLASFTSTAAGILHIGYKRFITLAIIAIVFWNTLWGILVYSLGEKALTLVEFRTILFFIFIWVLFEGVLFVYRKRNKEVSI